MVLMHQEESLKYHIAVMFIAEILKDALYRLQYEQT